MKSILKFCILLCFALVSFNGNASNNDDIVLTVTSDGSTKDEAVKNALRLALEQAYGTFVSANTTILNDELVKDEIVTISTGAIKEYEILSVVEKANGSGYMVTAKATVSLPNLVTYAKNHGSECEFAGNTFSMQMKLWELQKKNEFSALENSFTKLKTIVPSQINWQLEVGEPMDNAKTLFKDWIYYEGYRNKTLKNKLKSINLDDFFSVKFTLTCHIHSGDVKELKAISLDRDEFLFMTPISEVLHQDLRNIALNEEEIEAKKRIEGKSIASFKLKDNREEFVLRNDAEKFLKLWDEFAKFLFEEMYKGLGIQDNTCTSNPHLEEMLKEGYRENSARFKCGEFPSFACAWLDYRDSYLVFRNDNKGLFKYPFIIEGKFPTYESFYNIGGLNSVVIDRYIDEVEESSVIRPDRYLGPCTRFSFTVLIPKDEIGKYSSFKIVKK